MPTQFVCEVEEPHGNHDRDTDQDRHRALWPYSSGTATRQIRPRTAGAKPRPAATVSSAFVTRIEGLLLDGRSGALSAY